MKTRRLSLMAYTAACGFAFLPLAAHAATPAVAEIAPSSGQAEATMAMAPGSDEIEAGAHQFIKDVASRGLAFLSNPDITKEQQIEDFKNLLNDSFDLKTIGRFALGRYWRQATPEQREEYVQLFQKMVINSYAERFKDYQGQNLIVESARADSDIDTMVFSKIAAGSSSPEIKVDWRVRYKDGAYRVVDVLVEGVSMSLTQRSEFASIIQRGGGNVESLLEKLRSR